MADIGSEDIIEVTFSSDQEPNKKTASALPSVTATGFHIVKDFFGGPSTFSVEFEDDRASALLESIEIGMKVVFTAKSGGQIIMVGFVDSFRLHPGRDGKHLSIRGRDRLGMLADASIYPNLGDNSLLTTYQFKPTDSLENVVRTIFRSSPGITDYNVNRDSGALTAATGFGVGIRQVGKTGRGLAKNFQNNLSHLLKPEKGETYLAFATRICKRAGCEVRMQEASDNTVFIGPPTYDREGGVKFSLKHFGVSDVRNNVTDAVLDVDYKGQPSIIIAEGNHGGPTFKKVTKKVVCANEFTAYERIPNLVLNHKNTRPSVQNALDALTSGTNGYAPLAPNQALYDAIPSTIAKLQTIVSRPLYIVDHNSQTEEELKFFVAERMAHFQDQYFKLEYEVQGHSQDGIFWAPNLMVHVEDEAFHPTRKIDGNFWIRRVEFKRDRHGGSRTRLLLNLPYIHVYNVQES